MLGFLVILLFILLIPLLGLVVVYLGLLFGLPFWIALAIGAVLLTLVGQVTQPGTVDAPVNPAEREPLLPALAAHVSATVIGTLLGLLGLVFLIGLLVVLGGHAVKVR